MAPLPLTCVRVLLCYIGNIGNVQRSKCTSTRTRSLVLILRPDERVDLHDGPISVGTSYEYRTSTRSRTFVSLYVSDLLNVTISSTVGLHTTVRVLYDEYG